MTTLYVARDEEGEIISVAAYPAPDMIPPITEPIDSEDQEIKDYEVKYPLPHNTIWPP